jgi:hypothetical protein
MPFLLLSIIKNETFFHKGRREWRKRKKETREKKAQTSLIAAYQIHNTQALRFAPNDLCDVFLLLAAVTVLLMQAEKSDFSWRMLQNLCIYLIVLLAAATVLLLLLLLLLLNIEF